MPWASFDIAIAYSRSTSLRESLEPHVPRVIGHDPAPSGRRHASWWLAEPLRALEVPILERLPRLDVEVDQVAPLLARLPSPYVAIHPGSGSRAKNWPSDRFAAVLEDISEGRPWMLVEGPADSEAARSLRSFPGAVVAAGLAPRVLGAALARAEVYVGNDSGVSHLAAAVGAPTVALFGPTDPQLWAPIGDRVGVVASSTRTMNGIMVDEVLRAAAAIRSGANGLPCG